MYVHPNIQAGKLNFKSGFKRTPYGGKFKYLTFWDVVSDFFHTLKVLKFLKSVKKAKNPKIVLKLSNLLSKQ
jgi:hypothetical protein